jgi:hypothetical protein
MNDEDASIVNDALDASVVLHSPNRDLYVGYLTDDGTPPNGKPYFDAPEVPKFSLRPVRRLSLKKQRLRPKVVFHRVFPRGIVFR